MHVDLPGWTKEGLKSLQARCEELHLQPRGTRGESGGQTGRLRASALLKLEMPDGDIRVILSYKGDKTASG